MKTESGTNMGHHWAGITCLATIAAVVSGCEQMNVEHEVPLEANVAAMEATPDARTADGRGSASARRAAVKRFIEQVGGPPLEDHVEVATGVFIHRKALAKGVVRYEPGAIDPAQRPPASSMSNDSCTNYDYEDRQGTDAGGRSWGSLALGLRQTNGDIGLLGRVTASTQQPISGLGAIGVVHINGQPVGYIADYGLNSAGPEVAEGTWFVPCTGSEVTFEMETGFYFNGTDGNLSEHDEVDLTFTCCP